MKAIFKRELRSYFSSMLGYIFLTMFLALTGILFWLNNISFGVASVKNFFSLLTSWAVFVLPMLTMRLFAEDRKLKTDQLLITAPVSVRSIVLGKFFCCRNDGNRRFGCDFYLCYCDRVLRRCELG